MDKESNKAISDLFSLEQSLVRVPHEQWGKTFRTTQKLLEKEIQHMVSAVGELCKGANSGKVDKKEALKSIDVMTQRIHKLKDKLAEFNAIEQNHIERCDSRLKYLEELATCPSTDSEAFIRWNRVRVDRILVDYLLREGFYETASELAKSEDIEQLVDVELFVSSRKIIDSLQRGSCTECLQWCSDNKSKLKKIKSTLEFNLRIQEYIEFVRNGKLPEAIAYAKKNLTQWIDTHMKEFQRAMALLAFPNPSKKSPYGDLFDNNRWQTLVDQFKTDNLTLHSLTTQSILSITLHLGISSLKTPSCFQDENKNINCPVCNPNISLLAKETPFSHHDNSTIVCKITGQIMNEDNPPMVLPNGFIYSQKAIEQACKQSNGLFTCPRTGETYPYIEIKKVFIS